MPSWQRSQIAKSCRFVRWKSSTDGSMSEPAAIVAGSNSQWQTIRVRSGASGSSQCRITWSPTRFRNTFGVSTRP